jgi:hypothetical protein
MSRSPAPSTSTGVCRRSAVSRPRSKASSPSAVDEGIELLTGRPAGTRGADGAFREGSVHRRVEDRLRGYADMRRDYALAAVNPAARATRSG